jgi:hypothetical protein
MAMREYGASGSSPTTVMASCRRVLAQGLGGDDAGRAGAQDDVFMAVSRKRQGGPKTALQFSSAAG